MHHLPKRSGVGAQLVLACSLVVATVGAQASFSQVFVVGDSLSDTGNAAAVKDFILGQPFFPANTVGLCNPTDVFVLDRSCEDLLFLKSRVSNGPVGVEGLASQLGFAELRPSLHVVPSRPEGGTNYAVAGAKARASGPADLAAQVDALLIANRFALPPQALYVVMIGGNDVIDALQASLDPANIAFPGAGEAVVAAAVDGIADNLDRLIGFGARYLLLVNVPNVGSLPMVRLAEEIGATVEDAAGRGAALSQSFNAQLARRLDAIALAHPASQLKAFDLYAFLEAQVLEAAAAGRNTLEGCFDSESYSDSLTAERIFHAQCEPAAGSAPGFERFVFWDHIHPTAQVHAALGEALFQAASSFQPPPPAPPPKWWAPLLFGQRLR